MRDRASIPSALHLIRAARCGRTTSQTTAFVPRVESFESEIGKAHSGTRKSVCVCACRVNWGGSSTAKVPTLSVDTPLCESSGGGRAMGSPPRFVGVAVPRLAGRREGRGRHCESASGRNLGNDTADREEREDPRGVCCTVRAGCLCRETVRWPKPKDEEDGGGYAGVQNTTRLMRTSETRRVARSRQETVSRDCKPRLCLRATRTASSFFFVSSARWDARLPPLFHRLDAGSRCTRCELASGTCTHATRPAACKPNRWGGRKRKKARIRGQLEDGSGE